ncbi:hypothetical protein [Actinomadura sp. NPDC048394]|uniref:hypothetical protein n=1 Tax=Actinomadura sp. NPDC048394 TaxID=3158223 RepID=UPI0033C7A157
MHDLNCPRKDSPHEDAAKRTADTYNLHRSALGIDAVGQWFAVRLQDGDSDGELYESKRDAVRHQHHDEQWYAFVRIAPCSMSTCEAASFLRTNRAAYDRGMRLADPDHRAGGRELIPRLTVEDQRAQVGALLGRCRPTNLILPTRA